jgi:nucleotide-binding universal stress UspA family protein
MKIEGREPTPESETKQGGKRMAPPIKKILYSTDRSKNSSYAFLYAIDMAKKYDARIVVLHVIEPVPSYAAAYGDVGDESEAEKLNLIVESMKKHLEEFCRKADTQTGFPCAELVDKILVVVGHPPEEILNIADDEGCDVIVMGSHGKGFLTHTFLGSVSTAVLHRSLKPVLTIPLPKKLDFDWDGTK